MAKKPKATQQLYHVGLNPDAPFEVIHLAGFELPKRSERVEGYGASTKRSVVQGTYLSLTDDQVAAIKRASTQKVFRFGAEVVKQRGKKETRYRRAILISKAGSGFIGGKPAKPYEEHDDDVLVGKFIFLRKSEHNALRDESFETLLQDDEPPAEVEKAERPTKKAT